MTVSYFDTAFVSWAVRFVRILGCKVPFCLSIANIECFDRVSRFIFRSDAIRMRLTLPLEEDQTNSNALVPIDAFPWEMGTRKTFRS